MTSDSEGIVASLRQGVERLANAGKTAAHAHARATQMQSSAERTGFRGIAASIGVVLERLRRIQQSCDDVRSSVRRTCDALSDVAKGSTPDEVMNTLMRVAHRIGTDLSQTEAIIAELDSARTATRRALEGGKPGPMLAMLDQIGQDVARSVAMLGAAKERVEETTERTRQLGTFAAAGANTHQQPPIAHRVSSRSSSRRPPDGDYESLSRWAEDAYGIIRAEDDADKIAQNLKNVRRLDGSHGFSPAEIRAIRQHVFFEEHLLDSHDGGEPRRALFDTDEDIADAWIRLRTGRALPEDLVFLEHEHAEAHYMRQNPQATYREAHRAANQVANWERQIPAPTREDFNAEWR